MKSYLMPTYKSYLNIDGNLNPFYEFASYCAMKYDDSVGGTDITMRSLYESPDIIIKAIMDTLGCDDDKLSVNLTESVDKPYSVSILNDDKELVCKFEFGSPVRVTDGVGTIRHFTHQYDDDSMMSTYYVSFTDTYCFDYIFKSIGFENIYSHSDNKYHFVDYGSNNIHMILCIIKGLINFNDYMKYNKMSSLKNKTIVNYIKSNVDEKSGYDINYFVDYNGVVVVAKNKETAKYSSAFIEYSDSSYIDYMEEFFDKLV